MSVLLNVIMEPSNVKKKNEGTIECDKSTVTCDVGIVQYEDRTVKCEKKVREPPNVRKELLHVIWNCTMRAWNRQV